MNNKKTRAVKFKQKIAGPAAVIAIVIGFVGFMFGKSNDLQLQLETYNSRIAELNASIDAEEDRTKEIDELKAYMETDEYAESVARNRLGLVKDNDIVFEEETDSEN